MLIKRNRTSRFQSIELVLIILSVVTMVLFLTSVMTKEQSVKTVQKVTTGWYVLEGEQKVEVELPAVRKTEVGAELVLYHDTLAKEYAGKTISAKGAQYDLRINLGNVLLYKYEEFRFPRNAQMKSKVNCIAELPVDGDDEPISLHFGESTNGTYRIPAVYVGSGQEIAEYVMKEFFITVGIVIIMAVWVVIAFGAAIFLKRRRMEERRLANVGGFLLLCGIWCLTDSAFLLEHTAYPSVICTISFYAFMLMAIPMLYFVRNTGSLKEYKGIDTLIVLFSINAIAQGILNYFSVFEFIEMLFVTHLLLFFGVIVLVVLLIREYKKEKSKELKTILVAFEILAGFGVAALLLYWLFEIPYYGSIYEIGILVFVIALICGLIVSMVDNIIYKAEMQTYRRMAKEDKLTGLGNRRAFDDFVKAFAEQIAEYENAALIFMDLNGLKMINDTYGHSVGDELIIASANCIKKAFGEKGTCYRLGGDEFCSIILNPTQSEEELFKALDREIQNYNNNSRYQISIARGMSYIRKEDGSLQTISDWKYYADLNMYVNKGGKWRV